MNNSKIRVELKLSQVNLRGDLPRPYNYFHTRDIIYCFLLQEMHTLYCHNEAEWKKRMFLDEIYLLINDFSSI